MKGSREAAPLAGSNPIDAKLGQHRLCSSKHCPGCGHKLEQKPDWVGLPAGVKFDPTDQELIEHLEAKVMSGDHCQPHPLIDEFIATIEGEDGICYTHPEKLPGVTKDGLSKHFFHRPSKAYTTGTRKRRKIQTECDVPGGETRWHKTGKTRPVVVNGKQKGCKKILVLYTNFGKHRKPEKTNWVMHQYHLGQLEEEKEGELVVSKIFYQTQPRQCNWVDKNALGSEGAVDQQRRESTGTTASGSSSKEVGYERVEDLTAAVATSFNAVGNTNIPTMKPDHLISFGSLIGKSFDHEVGIEDASQSEEQHTAHQMSHEQQVAAAAAYHMTRPSDPCTIITSPPLHQATSIVLDHPYQQVSTMIHQGGRFDQQQLQQQPAPHQKMGGRSSGLEELLMGCTSGDMKGESSMGNAPEAEWLKYSFWTDPDNSTHHG